MAEKLKVLALAAAVQVTVNDKDGNPLQRVIGLDAVGGQVFGPATSIVFLDRGDELPDNLADGEIERLKSLEPPAVGTDADLRYFEDRLRNDNSPIPSWAQQQISYPGVDPDAIATTTTTTAAELTNLADMSDQDLVALYEGKPPTVKSLLDAVGDDQALAQRVLAAENTATSGDPRATLKAGLDKVIEGDAGGGGQ